MAAPEIDDLSPDERDIVTATHDWVIQDRDGTEIRRHPATQISREGIGSLEVGYLKPHQRCRKRPNVPARLVT